MADTAAPAPAPAAGTAGGAAAPAAAPAAATTATEEKAKQDNKEEEQKEDDDEKEEDVKESVDGVVVDGVVVKLSCVASALLSDNGKDVNLSVPIVRKHVMEDMPSSGFKASTMAAQPELSPPVMIECPDLSRVLVYPLGKVVAYDAASIDEAVHSVAEAVKIVQDSGYAVSPTDTAVENIVATFKLGRPVDLEVLSAERYDDVTYEPEVYHGCLLHGDGTEPLPPHSQAFLYPQGVAVFSGVTNMEMLREGVRAVLAFVQPYLM